MKAFQKTNPDLTVQETCAYFKVSTPTVYRLLDQGKLEGYTVGHSRRITHESIQRLREERS